VGVAVSKEDSYRSKATELRRQARVERNVSTRVELELLALGYDRLADQARRNAKNNVVYEYDPEGVERRRQRKRQLAQAQQQQQPQPPKRDR
jgi:hypothetical protein